jgi:hypothetical protein
MRLDECYSGGDNVEDLLAAGRFRMFSIGFVCGVCRGSNASRLTFHAFADSAELGLFPLGH